MAQVTVSRVKRLRDVGRSYKVVLDGATVAKVAGGKAASFEVAPGAHRIHCSIDGRNSPELEFHAGAAALAFECEAGEGRLSARADSRARPQAYIQLRALA
ncbi:MAG: hypothetical protein H0V33_12655 [Acidimicrobiia bacterium]|jgi:hypothetical protein|nr:hypothetical protein [Acidimicrobiia bacterium]